MFRGNIKEDFDNLRGDMTLEDVGKELGVHKQTIFMSFQRENVVAPQIVRLFDAIGYDISLTFIPKGSDAAITDTAEVKAKRPRTMYQIRRGTIRMNNQVPNTKYMEVSSVGMMTAIDAEGHDLSTLPIIAEIDNRLKAKAFYQEQRKDLKSREFRGHDLADVLTISRICSDGSVIPVNRWVGKLSRKATRGPGRPPRDPAADTAFPASLNDALHVLANREN